MIYLKLFLAYLKIGLFSIGGGHAAIPLVLSIIVEDKGWLAMDEFIDIVTISELTPGPFALNSATFIGMKLGGIGGGIVASLGCILPALFLVVLFSIVYKRYRNLLAVEGFMYGIRPATTGLIMAAGISILMMSLFGTSYLSDITAIDYKSITIVALSFLIIRLFKLNPIIVIIIAGVLGLIINLIIS